MNLVLTPIVASFLTLTLMHGKPAQAANAGTTAERQNMRLVGHHDLQGRNAYQPVIQEQDSRWIANVGHHGGYAMNPLAGRVETNGTSIVDVTDPGNESGVRIVSTLIESATVSCTTPLSTSARTAAHRPFSLSIHEGLPTIAPVD